jgi:OmpA-OmpF porin, OOP family
VKIRAQEEAFACASTPARSCATRFGHELPFGLGLSLKPQPFGIDSKGRFTFFVETHGYVPVSPIKPFSSSAVSEVQLAFAARFAAGDFSLLGGFEKALVGGVGNPNVRGIFAVQWAPRSHDRDGDGIEDDVDQCSDLPEDFDGFQDADGCPETDNDDDGVPDAKDKCPKEKEDEDGFQDADGCPDRDNDKDGILDAQDACPNEAGPRNADKKKNGCPVSAQELESAAKRDGDGDGVPDKDDACPDVPGVESANPKERGCPPPDRDKDTFVGTEDKCPDEPEDFNGFEDADGCPDAEKKEARRLPPLVTVKQLATGPAVSVAQKVGFKDEAIDPAATPALRAVASQLVKNPSWHVVVAIRSKPNQDPALAKKQAADVAAKLNQYARRESAARVGEWNAVKNTPRAEEFGIGFLVVEDKAAAPPKPQEAPKPPPAPKPDAPKPEAPKPEAPKPAAPKPPQPKAP